MDTNRKRRFERRKATELFERLMKKQKIKGWFIRYMKTPVDKLPLNHRYG